MCSRPRGSPVSYGVGGGGDLCFGLVSKVEVYSMQHAAESVHACVLQVRVAGQWSSVLRVRGPLSLTAREVVQDRIKGLLLPLPCVS